MRTSMIVLLIGFVALAQEARVAPRAEQGSTVASGVPLRVALESRVAIKRVGDPIHGRLVDSVYQFDRLILPAGTLVEGHIAEIGGVPASRRFKAVLSGNLTPPRDVRAQFDAVVLSDGSRLPLRSSLSARDRAHPASCGSGGEAASTRLSFRKPRGHSCLHCARQAEPAEVHSRRHASLSPASLVGRYALHQRFAGTFDGIGAQPR